MSSSTTSATRRSRSDFAAVSTAFRAASSQDLLLVPTSSTTLYTLSVIGSSVLFDARSGDREHQVSTTMLPRPAWDSGSQSQGTPDPDESDRPKTCDRLWSRALFRAESGFDPGRMRKDSMKSRIPPLS